MFGNLRLNEIHQTPTSYQVLSMQIQFVTHVAPRQLEKRNPNFKRFLFYELPFKFSLILMHWHRKFFALLYQFCCIFTIKLLLVGCLTFTLMVYPLQHQWYLIVMSNMVWVLKFLRVLCFQTFHLFLCYISQANLT